MPSLFCGKEAVKGWGNCKRDFEVVQQSSIEVLPIARDVFSLIILSKDIAIK